MNTELDFIFNRRSVRSYEAREIPKTTIRDLLEAAMAAPSACCKDPWHFVVVEQRDMLEAIAEGLPNGKILGSAAVGIVVCGDTEQAHDGQISYLLQDCSAAIENLLLAAEKLGLGACWLGVHPREERVEHIRNLLGMPANVVPVSAIALGWPRQKAAPRTRYQDTAVHWELW